MNFFSRAYTKRSQGGEGVRGCFYEFWRGKNGIEFSFSFFCIILFLRSLLCTCVNEHGWRMGVICLRKEKQKGI